MWSNVFEALLNGVALFLGPLALVAALAGVVLLLDRLYYFLRAHHHLR